MDLNNNADRLLLRYPVTLEQMIIKSAFFTKAFELLDVEVTSDNETMFEPEDCEE